MKSKLFLLGATLLLFLSCSNDLDSSLNMLNSQDKTPLDIHVVSSPTKAEVSGNFLPNNSEIGVYVTKSDGSDYKIPYNNIKYKGTGNTYANTWEVDKETPVYLSSEKATAYAYYPRQASGVSLTAIPITNDGTDWMYSTPVEDLDLHNSTANFTMQHAMSILRVKIERSTSSDHGLVSMVNIYGDCYATSGILNLQTGIIEDFRGIGSEIVKTNVGTIGESALSFDQWVVPTGNAEDISFIFTIDGQNYRSTLSNVTFLSGKVYNINLKFSNSVGLSINSVSVTDWEETTSCEMDMFNPIISVEKAKSLSGVYGMLSDGRVMMYNESLLTKENIIGVAFFVRGKGYQVAKVNASGYDGDPNIYWQKIDYHDIKDLTNYNSYDSNYLHWSTTINENGSCDVSIIPDEWVAGSLSDFKGKENTEIILADQGNGTVDYTIGKAVMDFRKNASVNDGFDDWFIPAYGELVYMYLKRKQIDNLLVKISGVPFFNYYYWSSTEDYSNEAWIITFDTNGWVHSNQKDGTKKVRLIRAL